MNTALVRCIAHAALLACSLRVILVPATRDGAMKWLVLSLFLIVTVDSVYWGIASGELRMSVRELMRRPPRNDWLETSAVFSAVAAVLILL